MLNELNPFLNNTVDHDKKMILFWDGVFCQWTPTKFTIEGVIYNSAEQYMMAQKALLFEDEDKYLQIMESNISAVQKELGRFVNNFHLPTWELNRVQIVTEGSLAKFGQNPILKQHLLNTLDYEIVEASPTDRIWGIGLGESDPNAFDKSKWEGQNLLGKCIMSARNTLTE